MVVNGSQRGRGVPQELVQPYHMQAYFALLENLAADGQIAPTPETKFNLRHDGSKVIAWEAKGVRLLLAASGAQLFATEQARVADGWFEVLHHHYHYKPSTDGASRRWLRFCLDKDGCHVNADPDSGLPHRALYGQHHHLEIDSLNTLLALVIALEYSVSGEYSVDNDRWDRYNAKVREVRRQLK